MEGRGSLSRRLRRESTRALKGGARAKIASMWAKPVFLKVEPRDHLNQNILEASANMLTPGPIPDLPGPRLGVCL